MTLELSNEERTQTTRLSDDGERLIIVERWLDRQVDPPRWRSKNWHRKLTPGELTPGEREYLEWLPAEREKRAAPG